MKYFGFSSDIKRHEDYLRVDICVAVEIGSSKKEQKESNTPTFNSFWLVFYDSIPFSLNLEFYLCELCLREGREMIIGSRTVNSSRRQPEWKFTLVVHRNWGLLGVGSSK